MNRLLLAVLVASLGLVACSKETPPPAAKPASPHAGMAGGAPAAGGQGGKVVQAVDGGGYTYAEVELAGGQKVWVAGGSIAVKPGDVVQWNNAAVMRNFTAKSLNRTFDQILFVSAWGPVGGDLARVSPHGTPPPPKEEVIWQKVDPASRPVAAAAAPAPAPAAAGGGNGGKVKSVAVAGGYSYIEVDQGGASLWLAVTETPVKPGDQIRWDGGAVMQNFNAKSLGRTFDRIVFAGGVTVVR